MKKAICSLTAAAIAASVAGTLFPASFASDSGGAVNADIDPDTTLWYDEYAQDNMNVVLPSDDDWAENAKWDYEEVRALPVGNGRLGAMVYGRTDTERIQINESTVWTGGPHNYVNTLETPITKDNIDSSLSDVLEDGEVISTTAEVYDKACELVLEERISEATALIDKYFMGNERYETSYQPFVDMRLDFGHDFAEAENYIRTLNTETALATVDYDYNSIHYSRETLSSFPDQVIATNIKTTDGEGSAVPSLSFSAYMDSEQNYSVKKISDSELALTGTVKTVGGQLTNKLPNAVHFEARLFIDTDGSVAYENDKLKVSGASYATVYVTGATNYIDYKTIAGYEVDENGDVIMDSCDDDAAYKLASDRCEAIKAHLGEKTYDAVKADHTADYQSLNERSSVDFSGDASEDPAKYSATDERIAQFDGYHDISLMKLYFNYGKYLLISSSRPIDELTDEYGENMLPTGQPANLQGIWNWNTSPGWGSKYTTNINTQMNYFMAQTANLAETEQTLFDALSEVAQSGERTAKVHYGADTPGAWVLHHNFDLWRGTAPVDGASSGMWPTGGAWFVNHFWEYYSFNQDEEFLADAYPIMKGSAEFFEGYLREYTDPEDGKTYLVSPASISPEHGDVRLSPTMDNSLIKNVFIRCAQAADILGADQEKAALWRDMAAKIPGYEKAKYGDYIREWLVDETDEKVGDAEHRHPSQLWALHPGLEISPYDNTEEEQEIFDAFVNALERRGEGATGWSVAWRVCMWARAGVADKAYSQFTSLIKKATAPNLFDMHPADVFQIDGNFGCAAGVIEMLMQSTEEDITLLPALPAQWRNGSFSGLRARGGHTVDISWEDGNAKTAEVTAGKNGDLTIRYVNGVSGISVQDQTGAPVDVTAADNGQKFTFTAKEGCTYTITGFTQTEYVPAPVPTPEPPSTPKPIEYLNNGDMEGTDSDTNIPYWWDKLTDGDEDTVTVQSDYWAHGGSKCSLVSQRTSPASGLHQYMTLDNNKKYTVSAWVKSDADDTVKLNIRYDYWDDDTAAETAVKAGDWTLISAEYTTRASGTVTQFVINTTDKNADLRVDDASISAPAAETPEPSPTQTAPAEEVSFHNGNMEGIDPDTNIPYWWGVRKADDSDTAAAAADTDAYKGSYSLLISNRASAASAAEQYIELVNGNTYSIGAWVKCSEADNVRIAVRYGYWEDDIAAQASVKAGEWTYVSAPYTVRDSGTVTQLLINTENTAADLRIDEVSITPAEDEPGELVIEDPVYSGGTASVAVTNSSGETAQISVYAASYDSEGALETVRVQKLSVPSDDVRREISVEAKPGGKLYVWDENMKPYLEAREI